jgi:hypothetical protein
MRMETDKGIAHRAAAGNTAFTAGRDVVSGPLDLSGETPPDLGQTKLQPYDPRPQEDKARRNIAYALIGLLFLVVFAVIGLVGSGAIGVADIKEFGVIIGPLVALVSAATGFYYGNR